MANTYYCTCRSGQWMITIHILGRGSLSLLQKLLFYKISLNHKKTLRVCNFKKIEYDTILQYSCDNWIKNKA